ncbi:MAG TPA: hypothetical protein PKA32_02110 [Candidatus Gracilibacteria bacterium]|nr:hypothetical protein [Candidatus Gracilibacteria bacterium]
MVEIKEKSTEVTSETGGNQDVPIEEVAVLEMKSGFEARAKEASSTKEKIPGMPYSAETLTAKEITPEIVQKVTDLFRYTFNNDFGEFVVHQLSQEVRGARDVFGCEKGESVDLERMDSMAEMPKSEDGQPMELFHHPEMTYKKLMEKFMKGYLMLITHDETGEIGAFTFGYVDSLQGVFDKEWKYRFAYTENPSTEAMRDEDLFFNNALPALSHHLTEQTGEPVTLTPESEVFCWNCGVVRDDLRRTGIVPFGMKAFFEALPKEKIAKLGVIGETQKGTKPHRLLQMGGFQTIENVLSEDYVLLVAALEKLAGNFSLPAEVFKKKT